MSNNDDDDENIALTWRLVVVTFVISCCLSSSRSAILWLAAVNCSSSSISRLCDLSRSFLSSWKSVAYTVFCSFSTATSVTFSSNCFFNSLFVATSSCFSCKVYNKKNTHIHTHCFNLFPSQFFPVLCNVHPRNDLLWDVKLNSFTHFNSI